MLILRQKNYAKINFRNKLKKLYHNTGPTLNRRLSRTAAVTVGQTDSAIVAGVSNIGQPIGAAYLASKGVNPAVVATVGAFPTTYVYPFTVGKAFKSIPIGKGKKVGDFQNHVSKKVYKGSKKFLDKHGVNENMKNLDETTVGKELARVYKAGEKTVRGVKKIIKTVPEAVDVNKAPMGNLSKRPVLF